MEKQEVRFTLRIAPQMDAQVKKIAEGRRMSKTAVIIEACQALIDRHKRATRRLKE